MRHSIANHALGCRRTQPYPGAVVATQFEFTKQCADRRGTRAVYVCQIPVWRSLNTLARFLRTFTFPQRWPACRGDACGLRLDPDVLQYLVNIGAEGDESEVSAKTNLCLSSDFLMRIGTVCFFQE
ncbi:hypothetical protein RA876_13355 [Rhodoferax antarcticus]|nr:hypothetical protein RA876_13355 [Rhodoferax antarcticus]